MMVTIELFWLHDCNKKKLKVFGKGNLNNSLILFVKNKSYLAEVQFYMSQDILV